MEEDDLIALELSYKSSGFDEEEDDSRTDSSDDDRLSGLNWCGSITPVETITLQSPYSLAFCITSPTSWQQSDSLAVGIAIQLPQSHLYTYSGERHWLFNSAVYFLKNASRGQEPYQLLLPSLALSLVVPSVPSEFELMTGSSDDDRRSSLNWYSSVETIPLLSPYVSESVHESSSSILKPYTKRYFRSWHNITNVQLLMFFSCGLSSLTQICYIFLLI